MHTNEIQFFLLGLCKKLCSTSIASTVIIATCSIYNLSSPLHAASIHEVIPVKERNLLLNDAQHLTHLEDHKDKGEIAELQFPFKFEKEKEAPDETEDAPAHTQIETNKDKQILTAIAKNLNATGVIVQGNKPYLVFPNGTIARGGIIKVNYKGKNYSVIVSRISRSRYELSLNSATIVKYFEKQSNSKAY